MKKCAATDRCLRFETSSSNVLPAMERYWYGIVRPWLLSLCRPWNDY
jgi:hypothetical protein